MSKKEKLKELFTYNTVLKLISIAIAFMIWVIVVNISNPEVTDTVTAELSVQYANELTGIGKTYSLDTTNVRVSYKVRSNYRRLVHPSNFKVYVDMRDYSVTGAVPVYVDVDDSVSSYINSVSINPIVVHVDTEDMVEKTFDLHIEMIGTPGDGKVAGPVTLSSESITLYGPASELGMISKVSIDVPVDGALGDVSGTGTPVFYDASGNEITLSDKTIIKDNISYRASIYNTKNMSISVNSTGTPADGYVLDEIDTAPSFVSVYGPQDILDKNNTISIPDGALDISGAAKNVTVSLNVEQYLPAGLYINGSGEVSIAAHISKLQSQDTDETTAAGQGSVQESETEPESETVDETNQESRQETKAAHETAAETKSHIMETKQRDTQSEDFMSGSSNHEQPAHDGSNDRKNGADN